MFSKWEGYGYRFGGLPVGNCPAKKWGGYPIPNTSPVLGFTAMARTFSGAYWATA